MRKKIIAVVFPKDSEAMFTENSNRTFGGASVQMHLIARELQSYIDIETFSFIPNYKHIDLKASKPLKLVTTFNESDNILLKILKFHRTIKQTNPEAIFQRGLTAFSCLLSVYCRLARIKFVFMFAHDIEAEGIYQSSRKKCRLFPILIKYSHLLIVQNKIGQNTLQKKTTNRIYIFKKGLDFSHVSAGKSKPYDAIWIARCEPWKHPEIFLKLAELNKELNFLMICPKVENNKKYFEKIQKSASETKNLTFLNFVANEGVYDFLSQSKVFCITSEQEGDWPMVVLEACSLGLPILSLKLNYSELITKHNGGIFCEDQFYLFNKNLKILLRDKKKYGLISQGARTYVNFVHDIKKNIERLLWHLELIQR